MGHQPIQVETDKDAQKFCSLTGMSTLTPEVLASRSADAHWMIVDGDEVLARCSLWWTHTPPPLNQGETLGLIGHYAAADDGAASQLLQSACEKLSQHCTRVAGPMDGNTWHSYRVVTDRGTEPPFFLEPWHPDGWGQHFEAANFETLSSYFSAINADLKQDARLPELEQKMTDQQITIRALNQEKFEHELKHIYDISIASFQQNYLYTPVSLEEFVTMYLPIQQYVQPQLVTLAEQDGKAVGFQFSIPDLLQAQRGEAVDTVIIKTVAVLPEMGGSGLGSYLVADAHRAIQQMGFKRAIHALMYEDNISRKISAHYAEPMRRYTLFTKELT